MKKNQNLLLKKIPVSIYIFTTGFVIFFLLSVVSSIDAYRKAIIPADYIEYSLEGVEEATELSVRMSREFYNALLSRYDIRVDEKTGITSTGELNYLEIEAGDKNLHSLKNGDKVKIVFHEDTFLKEIRRLSKNADNVRFKGSNTKTIRIDDLRIPIDLQLEKYYKMEAKGYQGYGSVSIELDKEKLSEELKDLFEEKIVNEIISGLENNQEMQNDYHNCSNGDQVEISISIGESESDTLLKTYGVRFHPAVITYQIEGLSELTVWDFEQAVQISYQGTIPEDVTAVITLQKEIVPYLEAVGVADVEGGFSLAETKQFLVENTMKLEGYVDTGFEHSVYVIYDAQNAGEHGCTLNQTQRVVTVPVLPTRIISISDAAQYSALLSQCQESLQKEIGTQDKALAKNAFFEALKEEVKDIDLKNYQAVPDKLYLVKDGERNALIIRWEITIPTAYKTDGRIKDATIYALTTVIDAVQQEDGQITIPDGSEIKNRLWLSSDGVDNYVAKAQEQLIGSTMDIVDIPSQTAK